jgi:hypothetical protein
MTEPTLLQILDAVHTLRSAIEQLPQLLKLNPGQMDLPGGLSDLSINMGVLRRGNIIVSNTNKEITDPAFSGMFLASPPITIGGIPVALGGINAGTLNFWLNYLDGSAGFGGGNGILSSLGLLIKAGTSGGIILPDGTVSTNQHSVTFVEPSTLKVIAQMLGYSEYSSSYEVLEILAQASVSDNVAIRLNLLDSSGNSYPLVIEPNSLTFKGVGITTQDDFYRDGWSLIPGTPTYASATSINVAGTLADMFQVGDNIRLFQSTNGGYSYFRVTTVGSSTLTVTPLGAVNVLNESILTAHYSHLKTPLGVLTSTPQIMVMAFNGRVASNVTSYANQVMTSTDNNRVVCKLPSGVISNLRVCTMTSQPSGNNLEVKVTVDFAASGVEVTIPFSSASGWYEDTSSTVATNGTIVQVSVKNALRGSGTVGDSAYITCVQFDFTPN